MSDQLWSKIPELAEAVKTATSLWEFVKAFWPTNKRTVLFVGLPAAGKTVLFDHLVGGAGSQPDYTPPSTSQSLERRKEILQGKRTSFIVAPGQRGPVRCDGLELLSNGSVDGIVYVVSNGFIRSRNPVAQQAVQDRIPRLADARNHYREQEHDDFVELSALISQAVRKHRKPTWLRIAATKIDLYSSEDQLLAAQSRYSPHGEGAFAEALRELLSRAGEDNLNVDALPVCAYPEDFSWGSEAVTSGLTHAQRNLFLAHFFNTLRDLCG